MTPETGRRPYASELTERQEAVLRALVTAYVGEAEPVGSAKLSYLLPFKLSAASIRNTMAELSELGLIEKPHASAGRIPTEQGLRIFVDRLLEADAQRAELVAYARRGMRRSLENAPGEDLMREASRLLSEYSGQLGFAVAPRLERLVLRHVSLVRLSREKVLVVLISRYGDSHQRVIDDSDGPRQEELDRMATALNERVVGHTLPEVQELLRHQVESLRNQANRLLTRALAFGLRVLTMPSQDTAASLVIATRASLFDQPEFSDPERLRGILAALETNERLVELLGGVLDREGVLVALGGELPAPGLNRCALVAASYGAGTGAEGESGALGTLGVIGPSRMDYARVIPLVGYCSRLVTEQLDA